ncbi:hypothetical protein BS47DRAFT_1388760 [Hydnum rufescens UP504]|uniref:G domain-containing protein n=1 Tax=Hydnum rufescens UP504 TaxID=1448309 RepID=A0A9P6B6U6_9AGAM|nr:hypothetical protein BS47DRAFT_1388760 [Hydnum rufescens UP504]
MPDRAASPDTEDSTYPGTKTSRETAVLQVPASTNPTNVPQDSSPLRPTTDTLLEDSSVARFRVLVGKSGVGKSFVINAVFGVDNLTVRSLSFPNPALLDPDACYRDPPMTIPLNTISITSDDNHRLILHDSQGFLGGDIKNLKTAQEFIKRKGAERELKDRLHAIWLCCEIPVSGGRVCERGDEILLQDDTNKDILIGSLETGVSTLTVGDVSSCIPSSPDHCRIHQSNGSVEPKKLLQEAAKVSCEKPLNAVASNRHTWTEVSTKDEYKDTIERLINLTMNSILGVPTKATDPKTQAPTGEGTADSEPPNLEGWLFVAAQRVSGGTGYMFSGMFTHIPLDECIGVIHDDTVNVWNFNDPNHQARLASVVAQRLISGPDDASGDRSCEQPANPPTLIDNTVKIVGSAVGVATSAPPSVPYVLLAAIAVALASWAYGIYQRTPEILRYLMGYVIDLIIVMSCLFALVDSRGLDWISPAMVNLVLREYSQYKGSIHEQVKSYVNDTTLPGLRPKRAINQISQLVNGEQYKDFHKAVILSASRTLDNKEKWITLT